MIPSSRLLSSVFIAIVVKSFENKYSVCAFVPAVPQPIVHAASISYISKIENNGGTSILDSTLLQPNSDIFKKAGDLNEVAGKILSEQIEYAAPIIRNQVQAFEEKAEKFLQDGLQKDTVRELQEAFQDYPSTVSKNLDKNGYWKSGRGGEILKYLRNFKEGNPTEIIIGSVAGQSSSIINPVGDYWNKGRGREILDSLTKDKIEELVVSTGKVVQDSTVDAIGQISDVTQLKSSEAFDEVNSSLGPTILEISKTAQRLLDYSYGNIHAFIDNLVADTSSNVNAASASIKKIDTAGMYASLLDSIGNALANDVKKSQTAISKVVLDGFNEAAPIILKEVKNGQMEVNKAIATGVSVAVPFILAEVEEFRQGTDKFIQDGLQHDTIQELQTAFSNYPSVVASNLDPNGYWETGRGAEIIKLLGNDKDIELSNSVLVNNAIKEYWTTGRGAEIIKSFTKGSSDGYESENGNVIVAKSGNLIGGTKLIDQSEASFLSNKIIELSSKIAASVSKESERLIAYTGSNLKDTLEKSVYVTGQAFGSSAKGINTVVQSFGEGSQRTVRGLSDEFAKAEASITRVAANVKDVQLNPGALSSKLQTTISSIGKVEIGLDELPVNTLVQSIKKGIIQGGQVLDIASKDIDRGNTVAISRIKSSTQKLTGSCAALFENTTNKLGYIQKASQKLLQLIPVLKVRVMQIQLDTLISQDSIKLLGNQFAKAAIEFFNAGVQRDTVQQLKEAFQNYPDRISNQLDRSGYWRTGRGREILEQVNMYRLDVPFVRVK